MSGEIDVVLQQAVVFGGVATLLLAPSLPRYVPSPFRKWVVHLKRPSEATPFSFSSRRRARERRPPCAPRGVCAVLVAMLMYLFYLPLGAERKNFYSLLEVENNASKNDIVQVCWERVGIRSALCFVSPEPSLTRSCFFSVRGASGIQESLKEIPPRQTRGCRGSRGGTSQRTGGRRVFS